MSISLFRKQRSSRIGYEANGHFLNFWVGSPTHHRWYAFSLYIHF